MRIKIIESIFLVMVFVSSGLTMDLIHEIGHAICGMIVGGTLTYIQVAFFQIYPSLAFTSHFRLGYCVVHGLSTNFEYGLFLIGGSLTTYIAAWIIAFILINHNLDEKTHVFLKTIGWFGVLDLPFYIIFPQIGLRHWIIIGGDIAEPLIGAQKMGIPEPVFYTITTLLTIALVYFYVYKIKRS
jgi:hypothetical protein